MNTRILVSSVMVLALVAFAACAPSSAEFDPSRDANRVDAALDDEHVVDAPRSELWAPPRIGATSLLTPVRLVTEDPGLAGADVVLTADRDVGHVSASAPLRLREVDGWYHAVNGPGFSIRADGGDVSGPLTLSLRRAEDPTVIVASAVVEVVPETSGPSADPCLGGGNVAVWEAIGSYGGASGPVLRRAMSGRFDAIVRDVDVGEVFRGYRVTTEDGAFEMRVPTMAHAPLGEIVTGAIVAPGACASTVGDFVVFDHEEGERLSALRTRASRMTLAWRGRCSGRENVELRGCIHVDADDPQLPR